MTRLTNPITFEPEASIDINLTEFARLVLGVSYRYAPPVSDDLDLGFEGFSGPAGMVGMRFGAF